MLAFPSEGAQLQGATLLLPVVSVGNVGQLAADLIISTLQLPRTARLQDDALLPAAGHKGFGHVEGLTTAMELYRQQDGAAAGLAVVQQRSPAAPGCQEPFAQRLAAFVKQSGVKEVVVLGSIESTFRRDAQLAGPQLRYWAADRDMQQRCSALGVQMLEASFFEDRALEARLLPPWPLLQHLQQQGVPCAALLSFSAEGDNVGDAFMVATAAAKAVGLDLPGTGTAAADGGAPQQQQQQPAWVPPRSWQYVYGASPAVY